VKQNTLMPHCTVIHASIHQNSHQASLLRKFKKQTDLCFLNFVIKLPDDCSDKQKQSAQCGVTLKSFVRRSISFVFQGLYIYCS